MNKKTLVLGASENPERNTEKAVHRLREKGQEACTLVLLATGQY